MAHTLQTLRMRAPSQADTNTTSRNESVVFAVPRAMADYGRVRRPRWSNPALWLPFLTANPSQVPLILF